jgi:DNA-binding transcriptional regulator PaaX
MTNWLLLTYKVPNKPSARRVYIWRKLKRLGAILLNETVWILPDTSRTAEQFQWLAAEIQEMHGTAYLWQSRLLFEGNEEALIDQFVEQVDSAYQKLLEKINAKNPDLSRLSREYQQIASQDYFNSDLGKKARNALLAVKGDRS